MDATDTDIDRARDRLANLFQHDEESRFILERYIAAGAFGIAWKIKYRPSAIDEVRRIVLKTNRTDALLLADPFVRRYPGASDDAVNNTSVVGVAREKKWLKVLRWAEHIVKIEEPANDPLGRSVGGLPRRLARNDYMFMEYVENGVVGDFVSRCAIQGQLPRLPNRFLWRCFLCLLRVCIALAWPPDEPQEGPDGPRVLERARPGPGGDLVHSDMHIENVMFGPLINDPSEPEHDMVPILKAIDFGSSLEIPTTGGSGLQSNAVMNNLFEIGTIMCTFVTLNSDTGFFMGSAQSDTGMYQHLPGGPMIETAAFQLVANEFESEPYPLLDRELRNAICGCVATDPAERPRLRALTNLAAKAVAEYDEDYYAQRGDTTGDESDDNVRWLVQTFIFDAGTSSRSASASASGSGGGGSGGGGASE